MDIQAVKPIDLEAIKHLVKEVSEVDVLPELSEEGRATFKSRVLPDIASTFNRDQFLSLKAVASGGIIGFGALREGNYITHLFVSKSEQGSGLGKRLLDTLLQSTDATEINLRSSVNAVGFYKSYGFETTGAESEFNGIRFVPMRFVPICTNTARKH